MDRKIESGIERIERSGREIGGRDIDRGRVREGGREMGNIVYRF